MVSMYVLQGLTEKRRLYLGLTSDLRQRVKAHAHGLSRTTRRYHPMRLVYYEAYHDLADATEREATLKQFGGSYRNLLRRIRRSRLGVLTHGGAG